MNIRLAAVVLTLILPLPLARAEAPNSFRLQTAIDNAASAFSSVKEDLDSKSAGEIDSALFNLRGTKNEIDRQISEWQSVESRVSSDQSTVDRLRIEWEIAKSQYDQEEQASRNEQADLQRQLNAADSRQITLNVDIREHNRDADNHKAECARYDASVAAVNARGGGTPEEVASYNRWRESVNAWGSRVGQSKRNLDGRQATLDRERNDVGRRLAAIFNGAKLLEKRLALSAKERDHVNARAALERLRGEHNSRGATINGSLDSAVGTANALAASLGSIRRVVASSGVAQRTEYAPASRGAIPLPTEDLSLWEQQPDPRQALAAGRTFVLPIDAGSGTLAERPVERIRAGALQKVLSKYETKPVETASTTPGRVDSTSLVRTDLPIVGFGEIVSDADPSIDVMVVDLSKPVDPGAYFSTADFRSAKREEARFATLLPKLEAKLKEVSGWRAELYKHQGDLDALREETAKNNIANCLAIAQLGERAEKLAEIPRYAKAFTPSVVQAIKDSESIISGTLSAKEGWKSPEMRDKAEKASDTAVEALKMAMNNIPKSDPLYKWADGAIKAHQMLGKGYFLKWREDELKNRSAEEVRADRIMTAVEMIAVINVPAAVGLGLGNEITDWRLNKYYIEPAMEDVSAALSKNFDAEISLRRQIDRTKSFLEEERRIINAYNASPRRAANSLRGR